MTISKELLDQLLKGCERPEDLLGDAGQIGTQDQADGKDAWSGTDRTSAARQGIAQQSALRL